MKRLWVLRHAKSSWDHPGLADHDRPLAPRGRKAAKRIARWAEAHQLKPDVVLCSSAVRAQSTLDLVSPALGRPEVRVDSAFYHASVADTLRLVAATGDDVNGILLVGHNPTLHELTTILAPPGPDAFPTGALAGLVLAIDRWETLRPGCGRIDEFVVPRSLAH